jgi:hypothetical protein
VDFVGGILPAFLLPAGSVAVLAVHPQVRLVAVLEYVLLLGWAEAAMAAVLRTVRHPPAALGRGDPYDL